MESLLIFLFQGKFPLFGSRSCGWCGEHWSRWSRQWVRFLVFWAQFFFYHTIDILPEFLVVLRNVFNGTFRSPVALLSALIAGAILFPFGYGRAVLFGFSALVKIRWFLVSVASSFLIVSIGCVAGSFLIVSVGGFVGPRWFLLRFVGAIWSVMVRITADKAGSSFFLGFLGSSSSSSSFFFFFSFLL